MSYMVKMKQLLDVREHTSMILLPVFGGIMDRKSRGTINSARILPFLEGREEEKL